MSSGANRLDRRAVVKTLLADRGDMLAVTGLGSPTYDAAAAGDDDRNFYLWGAMGGSVMVGLGLALAQPARPVVVITGDGEMLMGMGSLATVGVQGPANLSIVVLDNERYGETGMQKSATAHGVELADIARGCRIGDTRIVETMDGVESLAGDIRRMAGPLFATVRISREDVARVLPSRDGALLRARFRAAVLDRSD
jgi:thiamine pyrophosphate-dependent acetolactate synthase large subunit-like protein